MRLQDLIQKYTLWCEALKPEDEEADEEVASEGQLDDEVEKLVAAIVKADARAIRMQKSLIRSWETMSVTDAIDEGVRVFTEACRSGTHRAVVQEVIERLKRK